MTFRLRGLFFGLLGLLALPALSACETAPGTGRTIFTGGMGPETEARLGYQEHQKIVPQFGGAYADPAIGAYVTARHFAERYGQTMAANILGLGLGILLGGGAQAAPPRHPPRETR